MHRSSAQSLLMMLISSALALSAPGCQSTQSPGSDSLAAGVAIPESESAPFVHEPTDSYTALTMHGFTVLVSKAAWAHQGITRPALELLESKLAQVIELTPEHTHESLRTVRFWIEQHNPGFPCACYHPGSQWLSENGYNTDKTGGIEITNTEHFVEWTDRDQPFMVLHELAHAYHDRVLDFSHPEIRAGFEQAQKLEKYESVRHISGQDRRHYGLNNEREYFAELTESYFGMNDFEPFTRDELAEFDPIGLEMIERMWGIQSHEDETSHGE